MLTHHRQEIKLVEALLQFHLQQHLMLHLNSQQEIFHFHPQQLELLTHLQLQYIKNQVKNQLKHLHDNTSENAKVK